MKNIPVHRIASAFLTILVITSIAVVLRKTGANHFYYGIPVAGLLSYVVMLATLKTRTTWPRAVSASILVPAALAAALYFGHLHGWPFGSFGFSDMLGTEIGDVVPWTVPVCWALFLLTSAALVRKTAEKKSATFARLFTRTFDAVLLTTLLMIATLPAMAAAGLMSFSYDIGYEGVGIQFYLASFVMSMLACALLFAVIGDAPAPRATATLSLVLATVSILAFWFVSSLLYGLPVAAAVGGVLIAWMGWKQYRTERL